MSLIEGCDCLSDATWMQKDENCQKPVLLLVRLKYTEKRLNFLLTFNYY